MFGVSKSDKRLRELEEQMLKLTRIVESHDLDWHDMRQRCKRLLDRTEKAAQRLETSEDAETQDVDTVSPENGAPSLALSPAQRRLQEQIIRQRQRKVS